MPTIRAGLLPLALLLLAPTSPGLASAKTVPAGLYHVAFGNAWWKSVSVESGKTTVLEPAILEVENAGLGGHTVVDSETGAEAGEVSNMAATLPLPPGDYTVEIGGQAVPFKVAEGQTTTLKAK